MISGIGIAGPTLAYWLCQNDFNPTLVERAPRPRIQGYIIDFWGRGYDVAERMGLLPALESEGYKVQELRFVDDRGRRVGGFGASVFHSVTGGRYTSLARGQLAELIYRRIAGRCETLFGDGITGIESDDNGARVSFEHAPARRFDLVIGADGLHSAVRKLVFGSEDRFEKYLGYAVAAFGTRGYRPRDEGAYVSYAVPGKQVARFALRDDRTVFLFVFAADDRRRIELHDTGAQKALLHAEFDHAGWECPRILAALDASDEVYFDRISQIRMETWSRGCIALVGDAAFGPSLLAGQGAALAMTAAYVLAAELGKDEMQPQAAFRRYEQLLRPFMSEKQRAAARLVRSFAPRTQLGLLWRNRLTKAFVFPPIARMLFGRSLVDRIDLPGLRTSS